MSDLLKAQPILARMGSGVMVPAEHRWAGASAIAWSARRSIAALLPRGLGGFDRQAWSAQWQTERNHAIASVPFYCEAWCNAEWNGFAAAEDAFTVSQDALDRQLYRFFPFADPLGPAWEAERRQYQHTTLAEALGLAGSLHPGESLVEIRDSLCDVHSIRIPVTNAGPKAFTFIRGSRVQRVHRLVWLSDAAELDPLTERNAPEDWPDDRCRIPRDRRFTLLGREQDLVRWWAAYAGCYRPAGILVKLALCGDDPMDQVRQRLLDRMPGLSTAAVGFLLHHRVLGYLGAASTASAGFRLNWRRFHCAPSGSAPGLLFSDLRRRRPAIVNYHPERSPVNRLVLAPAPMLA